MLNFDFLEEGLGIVSPPHFVYDDISRKVFLKLYSINCPNFIFSLPLLFKILGNMCTVFVCFPGFEVIKFEIKIIFLIKPFSQFST